MITPPSSIPRMEELMGPKIRVLRRKPRKIANPPIRGMGWLCIRRLSLGTSTAPTIWAMDFTTGVAMKEISRAATSAAAIRAMAGNSIVILL